MQVDQQQDVTVGVEVNPNIGVGVEFDPEIVNVVDTSALAEASRDLASVLEEMAAGQRDSSEALAGAFAAQAAADAAAVDVLAQQAAAAELQAQAGVAQGELVADLFGDLRGLGDRLGSLAGFALLAGGAWLLIRVMK